MPILQCHVTLIAEFENLLNQVNRKNSERKELYFPNITSIKHKEQFQVSKQYLNISEIFYM